ncbi:NADH:flavin oxidoreductase/NADH oxidase [Acerihabitans sp. TG2]|uniref:NADH:flavin oxidoreductase/NADH oxidase n=1 Tax=Acerihabitans sp. TG2 TaxID=3096008 RepID=UPI002B232A9C|nr:NADH:flavin oxidoreductase/NADH oxidase [Acerihabitans sp. TG2]MEA9391972.1 NADH:flavin oxidoreductase/NADH oxidase [Acerihabitans sp. TG2]
MSQLFSGFTIGSLSLPNRIVIAPMCQYSADEGKATFWHQIHLGHLALSGAALMIVEATAVSPAGRISPRDLGLWDDDTHDALADVVKHIKQHSPIALGIQLSHAGRKASTHVPWEGGKNIAPNDGGWQTLAPSDIPYASTDFPPQVMDQNDISALKADFVAAAKRAEHIGFDVIELHAAHGYLLHQFLSPLANHRQDNYGGSVENRIRLTLDIFHAIREAVSKQIAIGVRISATDWVDGGWDIEQSVVLANALKTQGCDYIHVSSGGLSAQQHIPVGPGYQVPLARRIKEQTGLNTIAVGLITEPEQAEAIVGTGDADLVALARAVLYDPRWPWHAAVKLGAKVNGPRQYWRCEPHYIKDLFLKE